MGQNISGQMNQNEHDQPLPAPLDCPPAIIVITGIMAAGKSTVAHLLAQRFARGVHVEADVLQRMIVSGGEWVQQPGEPAGEAARQLRLRLKNMCLLGISFFQAGFTVVLDDIILGGRWQELQEELEGYPFSLVVLAPSVDEVVQQRDRQRSKLPLGETWASYLDDAFRSTMTGVGHWIDTSHQTPEQTVEQILLSLRYP
jgi:predicted kinase